MCLFWKACLRQVGMEMYARWAHKVLWHDYLPGWALHKSHHVPRVGPFEANDIYAVANALPAMALCLYGFITPSLMGGVCFGAGLGITLFGIMYMFIHDGLVHRRFPVRLFVLKCTLPALHPYLPGVSMYTVLRRGRQVCARHACTLVCAHGCPLLSGAKLMAKMLHAVLRRVAVAHEQPYTK